MLLTKKDVFIKDSINPHHFCMPVVKNESDIIALRKAACIENTKFFLGTDSAPHHINQKNPDISTNRTETILRSPSLSFSVDCISTSSRKLSSNKF